MTVAAAKKTLADMLEATPLSHGERVAISKLVAKLCVEAIREDRAKRAVDPVANLFDVFFNGRPAR